MGFLATSVAVPNAIVSAIVESSNADDLEQRVQAVFDAVPGARNVFNIQLAGAGDGDVFNAMVQSAPTGNVTGPSLAPAFAAVFVVAYSGSDAVALAAARQAAFQRKLAANPGLSTRSLVSDDVAGASKGHIFMGLAIYG